MECQVCFSTLENKDLRYSCADPKCQVVTCADCTLGWLNLAHSERKPPVCTGQDCRSWYIQSGLKGLDLELYNELCFNYFMKSQKIDLEKELETQQLLEKLRAEKHRFIVQNYPAAISLVSEITFTSKKKRIDKQLAGLVQKKLKLAKRKCFNLTCKGYLAGTHDLVCTSCLTEFCAKCEKKLTVDHQCKPEDLEAVSMIAGMTHCPGCQLPIFKDQGCDSITCANCGTNFLYSTGQAGGHGSQNSAISTVSNQVTSLSVLHPDLAPEILELLLRFESKAPQPYSRNNFILPLKRALRGLDDPKKCHRELARRIDKYYTTIYLVRDYQAKTEELEHLLNTDLATAKQFLMHGCEGVTGTCCLPPQKSKLCRKKYKWDINAS